MSTNANWEKTQEKLDELLGDVKVIKETNAVIESWCSCMGHADYALRVFGSSLESIKRLSATIREKLASIDGTDNNHVSTESIVGSSYLDREGPTYVAKELTRVTALIDQCAEQHKLDGKQSEYIAFYALTIAENIRAMIENMKRVSANDALAKVSLQTVLNKLQDLSLSEPLFIKGRAVEAGV
ncbi:MAG: hypothetical protein H6815_02290 [Phycisphaeraceae bacterium]|nr:hypothetical protein [Phycisphaerales bacterium]MCB9859257.1 hypothetical protein [Phycisphaeraceae bacterium]